MKKLLFVVLLLIIASGATGGYAYRHSKAPFLVDSDGKDIYQHGLISTRTLFGYEVVEGDICTSKDDKDFVLEKLLWEDQGDRAMPGRGLVTYNLFECPNGCEEGRCLR